ncbi:MAG TPA: ArgE/DapE family deacylase [Longimicrobiales bacterium]|nr:ArgE/DapE family deacylase [Longimicrobiales bacterium]
MDVPLTSMEARVADAVDAEGLVDTARRLVRIPSWDGKETPAQELVASEAVRLGLEVDVWELPLDELAAHPAHAAELERTEALGVVGTLPGRGGGRDLILNGHVDVVPPGDGALWDRPPFSGEVAGGYLHGRGALDLKGPLTAGLYALAAVRAAGVELAGTAHLQSVVGEEDGGSGTLAALERGWRADGAVVMEPTELAVAPAQAGALNFRIRVPGLAAHGAVREEGVSAIDNFLPVHAALRALEEERNRTLGDDPLFDRYRLPFPICVGTLRAGDWASSVPDHLTLEGRFGVAPGEDLDAARRSLVEAVEGAAAADPFLASHPPRVTWWGGQFEPARTSPDHPLVHALVGAATSVNGFPPSIEGMPYGADMGLLVHYGGVPTVLYGPGDVRRAHRPDEWVAVEELATMARTLAVAILRFCGADTGRGRRP